MVNVDLPVALAIFLIFLVVAVVFALNYFSNIPNLFKNTELRSKAEDLYSTLFESKGTPENWETSNTIPASPGLMTYLRKVPITIKETAGMDRTNEPVVANVTFDDDCINDTWNNTVRIYDSDLNEVPFNLTEQSFCSSQFLKTANLTFNVNISANQNKKYDIYFSDDESITASSNRTVYNTASFVPSDGDSWTETTSDWSRYAGSSGSVALDTSNKKIGTGSVSITGVTNSNGLGLEYNPAAPITGISNGWYLRAWLLVDDKTSLNNINVSVGDGSDVITLDASNEINSNGWYLFEKPISSSVWANWSSFNAGSIDFVRFFVSGTTGLTKTLKIDGLRFEKAPLSVTVFPEEEIKAISPSKASGVRNMNSEEVAATGEGYKFRVEIEQK
jgi:hypothetical protein